MKPFKIEGFERPLVLGFEPTARLLSHEETEPATTSRIARSLKARGVVRHPIVIERTKVVLDGSHRLSAFKELGFPRIPACEVDYSSPTILVERWIRAVSGLRLDTLLRFNRTFQTSRTVPEEAEERLRNREASCVLQDNEMSLIVEGSKSSLTELLEGLRIVESRIVERGGELSYCSEEESHKLLELRKASFILVPPRLEKDEVLSSAHSKVLLPRKSTRHIIPHRPLRINAPLELCVDPSTSIEEADRRLLESLQYRKRRVLPVGSRVGSRRYYEEVVVFQ